MRNIIKKTMTYAVIFSFIASNTAYAGPEISDTLRSISTSNAGMGGSMVNSLLEVPNYINAGDVKHSSSGVITPEDIFEKKLAFALISPYKTSMARFAQDSSKIFTRQDMISYIEDRGFEVISVLPIQHLSRKDAEEFLRRHKSKPFFKSSVENIMSRELTPVIFRGPRDAWIELKEITAELSDNNYINRIDRPESFERTLEEILFFTNRTESPYFIASTESIMKSVLKDSKSQKPSSSGIGNRPEESIPKSLTGTSLINDLANHTRGALQVENEGRIKFGTSGFRGIKSLNILTAAITAQANADYIKRAGMQGKVFAVCRDTRQQGDIFIEIAASIFASNGIKTVVYEGYTPTPVVAYETVANSYGGAVNFTASHNSKEYKGYKFTPAHGGAAPQEVTDAIEEKADEYFNQLSSFGEIRKLIDKPYIDIIFNHHRIFTEYLDSGVIELTNPMERYVEYLLRLEKQGIEIFDKVRGSDIQIATSGLHGTAGPYFERIFGPKGLDKLAGDVLNKEPREDFGSFKAPEANRKNLSDLIEAVDFHENTLGVSGDGDGDREGIVDINGKFIEPNELAAIFYWYLHEVKGMKGGVAKAVATTNLLNALADEFNEKCYEKQVGFKNFMEEMLGKKAIVAAESSAHIGINSISWDDAFLCALLAYQIVSDTDSIREKTGAELKTLTDMLDYIQSEVVESYFSFYEGKITTDEATKDLLLSWNQNPDILNEKLNEPEFSSVLKSSSFEAAEISHQPKKGVKIVFTDKSWLCLRPSGTEPLIRLYTEGAGKTEQDAYQKREVLKVLAKKLLDIEQESGPSKASLSGNRMRELRDAEKDLDALVAQSDNTGYGEVSALGAKFENVLFAGKDALMEQLETAEETADAMGVGRDKTAAIWRGAELYRMLESIKAYKRLGEKVKIDTAMTSCSILPEKMGNRYAQNKDTARYIEENLNHEFIFNDSAVQAVEYLKQKGISEKNIFIYTFEQDKTKIDKMHEVLAGRRVMVLEDSKEPLLWPFQRFALTAKAIIDYQAADNSQKGYYRNALNTLLKSLQGSAGITACIDNILRDPARYVIKVLAAPVSALKMYQRKKLTEKLNKMWA